MPAPCEHCVPHVHVRVCVSVRLVLPVCADEGRNRKASCILPKTKRARQRFGKSLADEKRADWKKRLTALYN